MNDKSASSMMSGISEFLEQEETDRLVELNLEDVDPDPDQDRHSWEDPDTIAHVEAQTESARADREIGRLVEIPEHAAIAHLHSTEGQPRLDSHR